MAQEREDWLMDQVAMVMDEAERNEERGAEPCCDEEGLLEDLDDGVEPAQYQACGDYFYTIADN